VIKAGAKVRGYNANMFRMPLVPALAYGLSVAVMLLTAWVMLPANASDSTAVALPASPSAPLPFPVSPHPDSEIEWWYVNAHVTTDSGRHYGIVCAFFRFGSDAGNARLGMPILKPGHYLIYAITDLDRKKQRAYSLADESMMSGLRTLLLLSTNPNPRTKSMLQSLLKNAPPSPHRAMTGTVSIEMPFALHYGTQDSLEAMDSADNQFELKLGDGKDRIDLDITARKPTMPVSGNGETGLVNPTDMYYFSLTRCAVAGTVDAGSGPRQVKSGQGWVDHQWGSSWVTRNNGWDWWGIQLDDGRDILLFQQRDLSTGKPFYPLATFMDKSGNVTVTRKIVFKPVPGSSWRSSRDDVRYPLKWDIDFPEDDLSLRVSADVPSQEIPILSPSGDIWEGSCTVIATALHGKPDMVMTTQDRSKRSLAARDMDDPVHGVAYMELVGYSSPAVRKQVR
jgi:predicted secreted hydrolase